MHARHLLTSCLIAGMLAAFGCGRDESPDALLASAKAHLENRNYKTASIEARNALNKRPDWPEGRFVLGRILLDSGDPVAASVELLRATETRFPADQVVPLLLESWLASGRFDEVLADDKFRSRVLDPDASARVSNIRARAMLARGRVDDAKALLDGVLAVDGRNAEALVLQARIKLRGRDLEGATKLVEQALSSASSNAEAHGLRGDLYAAKGETEKGAQSYREAIRLRPSWVAAYSALILTEIRQGSLDKAKAELKRMSAAAPNALETGYAQGLVAYAAGDIPTAKDTCDKLLQVLGNSPAVLQLAGAVAVAAGSLIQAENFLLRAIKAGADSPVTVRLLAGVYVNTGQAAKAVELLEKLLTKNPDDAATLSSLGGAYLELGNVQKAAAYLNRAAKADPSAMRRTQAALALAARGDVGPALEELETVSKTDNTAVADKALIATLLDAKSYERALRAVDNLERKTPDDKLVGLYRGDILKVKGDREGARRAYSAVLASSTANMAAATRLAAMDQEEGKPGDAEQRYEAVLKADPGNSRAILAIVNLRQLSGASQADILRLLERAVAVQGADAQSRIAMVSFLLEQGELIRAIAEARQAASALPDDRNIQELLARAYRATNETSQALAVYAKLASSNSRDPLPQTRMGEIYLFEKNPGAAVENYRRALERSPEFPPAALGLVNAYVAQGRVQDAIAFARDIQKAKPGEVLGYILEGDAAVKGKMLGDAVEAYRKGTRAVDSVELQIRLHRGLISIGKVADANRLAEAMLSHPKHQDAFRGYLAETALVKGDFSTAAGHFKSLAAKFPNDPTILNNTALAMLGGQPSANDKSQALVYAEKANQLAPGNPAFMDTLAVVLAENAKFDRALDLSVKTVRINLGIPAYRLNYARILIKAGRTEEAKREIAEMAKVPSRYPVEEVAKAQADLK